MSSESVPVDALTEEQLQAHPVWRFRLDAEGEEGVDETHVTPAVADLRPGEYGSFIVSASYKLDNGQELPGAVQVDVLGSKVHCTPVLLCARGKQLDPLEPDIAARLGRITHASDCRPASWRLAVPIAGESAPRRGRIPKSRWFQAIVLLFRLIVLRSARRRQ